MPSLRFPSLFILSMACLGAALSAACGDDDGSGGSAGTPSNGGGDAGGPTTGGQGGGGAPATGGGGADGGGGAEAGGGGAGGGCSTSLPVIDELPMYLSDTGLYEDIEADLVAEYVRDFQPKYALWSDDADKRRWIYLPECGVIDTTDMDNWQMPVGTRLWKEFARDGVVVETRLIVRSTDEAFGFKFGTYVWDESLGDAVLTEDGIQNANGTQHDVPPRSLCAQCHRQDWRVLGFSALQLSHELEGETIASLSEEGLLSTPRPEGVHIPSDDPVVTDALGYMHANCGSCHSDIGITNIPMRLRLLSTQTTLETTSPYATAVNQPTGTVFCEDCLVVEGQNPEGSAMIQRISIRGANQMPQLATEEVDFDGVGTITTWIESLPPPATP